MHAGRISNDTKRPNVTRESFRSLAEPASLSLSGRNDSWKNEQRDITRVKEIPPRFDPPNEAFFALLSLSLSLLLLLFFIIILLVLPYARAYMYTGASKELYICMRAQRGVFFFRENLTRRASCVLSLDPLNTVCWRVRGI